MTKCLFCGTYLDSNCKYCSNCGAEIGKENYSNERDLLFNRLKFYYDAKKYEKALNVFKLLVDDFDLEFDKEMLGIFMNIFAVYKNESCKYKELKSNITISFEMLLKTLIADNNFESLELAINLYIEYKSIDNLSDETEIEIKNQIIQKYKNLITYEIENEIGYGPEDKYPLYENLLKIAPERRDLRKRCMELKTENLEDCN